MRENLIYSLLTLQFLFLALFEDLLYFLTLGSIRHLCLLGSFCLDKME